MSELEFVSVLVSVILALGIAEILRFAADTVRDPDHNPYWVHAVWMAFLLLLHIDFWAQLWNAADLMSDPSTISMIAILVGPSLLYVAARSLGISGNTNLHGKELYFQRKNAFVLVMSVAVFWSVVIGIMTSPQLNTEQLVASVVQAGIILSCRFTSAGWWHGVVALAFLGLKLAQIVITA